MINKFFCIFSDWIVGLIHDKINRLKNQLLSENAASSIHSKDNAHFMIQASVLMLITERKVQIWKPPPPPPKKVNEL